MTKLIALTGKRGVGKFAIVDDEDFEGLNKFTWHWSDGYATRMTRRDGKRVAIRLHWHILRLQPGFVIDHVNGDRLDNRRSNLRSCTRANNNMNKASSRKATSSQYKGVCWREHARGWKAYIKFQRKQIHLGYFKLEEAAARAYDRAATEMFGEFARLNFPQVQP